MSWRKYTRTAGLIFSLLLLLVVQQSASAQCTDLKKDQYWFVAPDADGTHGESPIYLRVSTLSQNAAITVSMPADPTFTPIEEQVPAGELISIDLTSELARLETVAANSVLTNGILVEATGLVNIYYEVAHPNNPAIFNLKGDAAMGTEFYVPFQTRHSNNTSKSAVSGFIVVASEDGTTVTVDATKDLTGRPLASGSFTVSLDKGETWHGQATGQATTDRPAGTQVTSDKPVAITMYDDNVKPSGVGSYDLVGDQLVSVNYTGDQYFVVRGGGGTNESLFVTAIEDGTEVYVDGSGTSSATLMAGDQYQLDFSAAVHTITTSENAYVMHMGGIGGEMGVALMPPLSACTGVSEVSFSRTSAGDFGMILLVPTGGEDDFIVNGSASLITSGDFSDVPGTGSTWKYYYASTSVPIGQNDIENTSSNFHLGVVNNLGGSATYGFFTRFGETTPQLGPDRIVCNSEFPAVLSTGIQALDVTWSNGTTADTFAVSAAGTYWVETRLAAGCATYRDSIEVINVLASVTAPDTIYSFGPVDLTDTSIYAGSDPGVLSFYTDSTDAVDGSNAVAGPTSAGAGTYYFAKLENEECACYSVQGFQVEVGAAQNDNQTTNENTALTFNPFSNDQGWNLDPTSVTVLTNPENGTASVDPVTGEIEYDPDFGYDGADSLFYRVCDAGGDCDEAWVFFSVLNTNADPIATDDSETVDEDNLLLSFVLANDSDPDGSLDVASVTILDGPDNGIAAVDTLNGSINYIPTSDWNGIDSIQYQVCDLIGACSSAWLEIQVVPVNDDPIAADDTYIIDEDNPVISLDVLANDDDPEWDGNLVPSTVGIITAPVGGSIVSIDPVTGAIEFQPDPDFFGLVTFEYSVCDDGTPDPAESILCDVASVNITVNPVNDAPVVSNDLASVNEDDVVVIDVLTNDNDDADVVGGLDPASVTVLSGPFNGAVLVDPLTGRVTYTPDADYFGMDSFQYEVCDQGFPLPAECSTAWAVITVDPVNDDPIAVNDEISLPEDGNTSIEPADNDSDPSDPGDVDPSTITIISGPFHGSADVDAGSGTVNYFPDADFNGTDSVVYQICDGGSPAACATATIQFNVDALNDAPVAVHDAVTTVEDVDVSIDILANDNDDADPLGGLDPSSISILTAPTLGSVIVDAITGEVTFVPTPGLNGLDSFQYQICDAGYPMPALCSSAWVNIKIAPVNDDPVVVNDEVTIDEDTEISIEVTANDEDPLDPSVIDPTTVSIVSGPYNGTATVDPVTGIVDYQPNPDFFGEDSLVYEVCDNGSPAPVNCGTATVYITVNPVNDAPQVSDDLVTLDEDVATISFPLSNDTDVDGTADPASFSVMSGPSNGSVSVDASGALTYTPDDNFHGMDSLQYEVCDDGFPTPAECGTAWIVFEVQPVNDPPVTADDFVTVTEDVVTILNPLDNDSDINDPFGNLDPLSLSAVDGPFHGTVVLDETTGGFFYTPAPNYFGMDSLQYIVCDDGFPAPPECEKAWIVIEVVPEDDQPTIHGTPTDVLDYCFGDLVLTPFVTVGEVDGDSLMAWVEIAVGYDASQDSLSYNGTLPSVWDPVTGTRSISASTAMELEASLRAVAYHNKRAPGGETGSERIFVAYAADWGGTLASPGDSVRLVIGSGNASICDADADGLADGMECPGGPDCNADLDDVPNYLDEDSDNDGIPDSHECGDPTACFDIDGDGTPDYLDTDSDNDGIPDYIEAGGPLPTGIDSDQDGIDDAWDYDAGGSGLTYLPSDTDGDGVHDFRDLDADNDGIADSFEAGADPFNPSDTDLDGLADYQDTDTDDDGIPDSVEADQPTASGVDTDRDGIDDSFDPDHGGSGLDTDPTDTDQDGVADFRDEDADNDGIADSYEAGDDPENPVDTDGDDVADYRDLDSDGDTIPDWVEADNPTATGNDADGDGIDDAYDTDANGSGLNTDPVDTDGDLVDDFRDLDTDGDGIPDSVEVGPNPEDPADTDGDGIADFRDLDSDGDGLLDNVDEGDGDCNGNGIPDWLDPETCDFMVVEVFTPNGDGFNDVFYVWGIFDHPDNELIVYNRWENVVYTRRGYDNSWDGSFQGNGEPLPDGTYYYVLKRNRNNSNSAVITGAVTIHR